MGPHRLVVAVAAACALGACTSGGSQATYIPRRPVGSPTSERTTLIGLVGTMSGRDEWRGTDAFQGAHFGLGALNRSISEDQPSFELITRDDRGDPARAASLVEQLASDPRYAGVIYAGPTDGLPPAEAALQQAGIPGILCYGDLYSARLLRSSLFQVSTPYAWEASAIASYLHDDRRYRTIGAIVERSLDGKTAVRSLRSSLRGVGGRRAIVERVSPASPKIRPALARLRQARAEAVVVQGSPATFTRVASTLDGMRAGYRTTAAARFASARASADLSGKRWRPQLIGFDEAIHPSDAALLPGTIAADSYARGVEYLPVPSFRAYRSAFVDWWGNPPLGWQLRAYEAVQMIGWAKLRTDPGGSVSAALERLRRVRFGGLDITFSPDDHAAVDASSVGLWTVPRKGIDVPERSRLPASLPWVPLARSFSGRNGVTTIDARDWPYLYRAGGGGAPRFSEMRFGVRTGRSDPVH